MILAAPSAQKPRPLAERNCVPRQASHQPGIQRSRVNATVAVGVDPSSQDGLSWKAICEQGRAEADRKRGLQLPIDDRSELKQWLFRDIMQRQGHPLHTCTSSSMSLPSQTLQPPQSVSASVDLSRTVSASGHTGPHHHPDPQQMRQAPQQAPQEPQRNPWQHQTQQQLREEPQQEHFQLQPPQPLAPQPPRHREPWQAQPPLGSAPREQRQQPEPVTLFTTPYQSHSLGPWPRAGGAVPPSPSPGLRM